jgi:hypothetical protein
MAPDRFCHLPTRSKTALLYRLCGDMNHAARRRRMRRPRRAAWAATYGMAGYAVLRGLCGYEAALARLRVLEARLSASVLVFRVKALKRGAVVLYHGRAELY